MNRLEEISISEEATINVAPKEPADRSPWKGLLWAEWFAHSQLMLIFLAVWLVTIWTLPLFTHTGWILLLGLLYALMAGPVFGGSDVLEGCEEFTFALPPTRTERFAARLIVGGGTLVILSGMNLIALGMDLPQVLAGLYVKSGLIKPLPILKPGLLYSLVIALPFAIFAFSFTFSSLTHSRMLIILSWFWGSLAALSLLQIGLWYEDLVWETMNGYFGCPLLLISSFAVLLYGFFSFQRKEIGKASQPVTLPGYWWLWMIFFVVGVGLALALLTSLLKRFPQLLQP